MASARRTLAKLEAGHTAPLRVRFFRSADRIANRIAAYEPGYGWRRMLVSIEGDAADGCPPSPVFQDIQVNHLASNENFGDAVMLIGAAGANRYSACVSCDRSSHEAEGISFDVACRCGAPTRWLGSCYRVINGAKAAQVGNTVRIRSGNVALQISTVTADGNPHRSPPLVIRGDVIEISSGEPVVTAHTTARWKYVVSHLPISPC